MAVKKITDEKELQTMNLKALREVVKHKFTNEEKDKLASLKDEKERRAYVIELYNKYIDEVIADEEAEKGAAASANANAGTTTPEATQETQNKGSETPENSATVTPAQLAEAGKTTTTTDASVSTAMSFTLTIRGAAMHNGTVSISCEKLLALVIRNPKAKYIFRSQARANEFLKILKSVSKIKGVVTFSEETRTLAIANIKQANGIK